MPRSGDEIPSELEAMVVAAIEQTAARREEMVKSGKLLDAAGILKSVRDQMAKNAMVDGSSVLLPEHAFQLGGAVHKILAYVMGLSEKQFPVSHRKGYGTAYEKTIANGGYLEWTHDGTGTRRGGDDGQGPGLPDPDEPPPMPPDDPDDGDDEEGPVPGSVAETVKKIWDKYGGWDRGTMLNEIAWIHRGEGWGLSRKTSGAHVTQPHTGERIAHDILHHLHTNTLWDVFTDRGPTWNQAAPHNNPERIWLPPVEP
jgi:hypothetical protein